MWAFLVPQLVGALAIAMGTFVGRAVLALGVGFVTYTGITVAVDSMQSSVISSVSGMPADMVNLVAYLWLDKGMTIIFSAVAASFAMRAIGGTVKKMVLK